MSTTIDSITLAVHSGDLTRLKALSSSIDVYCSQKVVDALLRDAARAGFDDIVAHLIARHDADPIDPDYSHNSVPSTAL